MPDASDPQPTKVDQALRALQMAKSLDALGRESSATGVFIVQLQPQPMLSAGKQRIPVSEAVALAFGRAVGQTFGSVIAALMSEASKLAAEAAQPQSPSPPAAS